MPEDAFAQAAPAAPADSVVRAEVLAIDRIHSSTLGIAPPQVLTRLRLRILSAREAPMSSGFWRGREGEELEVYAKEGLASDLAGKVITGVIVHRADERGGLNWIYDLKVETLKTQ
jgi:hypothetical protein